MQNRTVYHDSDIREPLFDYLEAQYGKIRIIEEKMMGRSRADVVMVIDDALVGLEIKSDADTYARLARQVRDYSRYYDYNYVVVGTSHAAHIEEHVPAYWGIITVEFEDGEADFYTLRRPQKSPEYDIALKLQILWRPELSRLLEKNCLSAYRQKSKAYVRKVLLDRVAPATLNAQISEMLFERDYTTIEQEIEEYRKERKKKPRRNPRGRG